jgi:hypothetical protein
MRHETDYVHAHICTIEDEEEAIFEIQSISYGDKLYEVEGSKDDRTVSRLDQRIMKPP